MIDPEAPVNTNHYAQLFLALGNGRINCMALNKLLFISHGWHLLLLGKPLLNEAVSMMYGPFFESIYDDFAQYGNEPIKKYEGRLANQDYVDDDVCLRTWETHKHFTAIQLANLCNIYLEQHIWGRIWPMRRNDGQCLWHHYQRAS